ncbi:MAG TPA: DUF1847 domain-containing protein [Fibrobacteria bacterium]|nr:DUF1847 domain-containing protein [Fibrobacteria bacterium]HOX50128.1 DUF1847 domain-containing protein [Fibrobacteria bacterium]
MECTLCRVKSCRSLESCGNESFSREEVQAEYLLEENQETVQAASRLLDGGRAGTLSRIEEIVEYAIDRSWKKVGLAYCYGMEKDAATVSRHLRSKGLRVEAVSCTTGALAQDEVNEASQIHKVSCNPLGQAEQIKAAGVDLVLEMGLCLGHDLMFRGSIAGIPATTLVVKDRTADHAPLVGIRRLAE